MPGFSIPYALKATHALSSRSWQISSQDSSRLYGEGGAADKDGQDGTDARLVWRTRRELDHARGEIGETVVNVQNGVECCVKQPVRGWYLLITSPAPAFKLAQQSSSSSQSTRSYVNLVPSRTDPATHFAFKLRHARDEKARDLQAGSSNNSNKRKSYVVVETKTDTDSDNARTLENGTIANASETKHTRSEIITSSFLLRPISHSAAKTHIHSHNHRQGHGHAGLHAGDGDVSSDGHIIAAPNKHANRISLRGIASLFTAQDNSFELLWEDQDTGTYLPILIYEDHPSLLRTETAGQLHMREELIAREFQMPSAASIAGEDRQEELFDPLTFFMTVGIAYLGFLEDQEAYKAASQG